MSRTMWIRCGCIVAAAFMAVVLFVGARKIGVVNSVPPLVHKVEHFLYYGTMAILIAIALGRRWMWVALLIVPVVGALDEWHQLSVPRRHGSPVDWMVDLAGVLFALYVYHRATTRSKVRIEA